MLYEAECLQLAWKFIEKNKYHAQHDQAILAMLIDFGSFRCSWRAFLCIHFFSTDVWTNSPPFVRTEEWCKTVYPGSRATMSGSSCARLERDGLSPNQFNIQPFMGLVSLNTALSGPYFLGGWHFWDPLRFPWFNLMKGHIFLAPFKSSNMSPKAFCQGFLASFQRDVDDVWVRVRMAWESLEGGHQDIHRITLVKTRTMIPFD